MKSYVLLLLFCFDVHAAYLVKKTVSDSGENIESVQFVDRQVSSVVVLKSLHENIAEKQKTEEVLYQEILYPDDQLPHYLKISSPEFTVVQEKVEWLDSEVREIIKQGENSNRITITILGDGYTTAEKDKFFADVDRMVKNMFEESTFKSYLSVFNIYAVFTPSRDSGISDYSNKDTALGLYRSPAGSKRAIFPGNRSAIERALRLVPFHTDYPIIVANDDFYGGLGGRYAITTRSLTSGAMVLRHELGHNFSNVGEEYDGGQVYSGANFSSTPNVSWSHWLEGSLEVHEAEFLDGSYVWQNLENSAFSVGFNFPKSSAYFYSVDISSVGWESSDDVRVFLDDEALEIDGVYTVDRSFFTTQNIQLEKGQHRLRIVDHNGDGNNVLAFANSYAYPNSYNFELGKVGAFKTFAQGRGSNRRFGYRPTHKQCLMKDMRSNSFCSVDQENIWIRFLSSISLIDTVTENNNLHHLKTIDLPDLSIHWYKDTTKGEVQLTQFSGKKSVNLNALGQGRYRVEVSFNTPEIRLQTNVTTDSQSIEVE